MTNKLALLVCLSFVAVAATGCGNDCRTYCRNQANFIDTCLPEFDQEWSDVGEGNWANQGQFVTGCAEQIDSHIVEEIEETCADAADEDVQDCENTVEQAVIQICGEHVNDFNLSCTNFWTSSTDFTPGEFVPPEPEGDDDDAGDDDDSAVDDDDAGDDDDSAGDDDDATDDDDASDDDDSAAGDDDDSAAGDDDDSAAGDDDDSAR